MKKILGVLGIATIIGVVAGLIYHASHHNLLDEDDDVDYVDGMNNIDIAINDDNEDDE
jgi:hypothetical protein